MTTDPATSLPAAAVPADVPPAAAAPATAGSLAAVPRLLRSDPVLAALIGAADATVAVPEAAQSVVAAALAAFTERTPLLVITATGLDAERLGDDLSCLIATEDDRAEVQRIYLTVDDGRVTPRIAAKSAPGLGGRAERPIAASRKVIKSLAVERRAPAPANAVRSQFATLRSEESWPTARRARSSGVRVIVVLAMPSGPITRALTRVS